MDVDPDVLQLGGSARAALRAARVIDAWQEHAGQVRPAREVIVPHMTRHPRGKEAVQHATHAVHVGSGAGAKCLDAIGAAGGNN